MAKPPKMPKGGKPSTMRPKGGKGGKVKAPKPGYGSY
jgi:hypothetical protein